MGYVILSKMPATWSMTLIQFLKKALGTGEASGGRPIVIIDTSLTECHKPYIVVPPSPEECNVLLSLCKKGQSSGLNLSRTNTLQVQKPFRNP